MTDLRKAAEMALEMFDWLERRSMYQDLQMKETHEALRQALAQPEREPVAWVKLETWVSGETWPDDCFSHFECTNFVPLYTAPPKKEWVGLTYEEVNSWKLPDSPTVFEFAQFIEAKLKEKNSA